MSNLQDAAKKYVESTLGLTSQLSPLDLRLPYHVQDAYMAVRMSLQFARSAVPLILLFPREDRYPGVVPLSKHIAQVGKSTDDVVVYVSRSLTPHERRSLISHQINFMQPGYQLFIPELAMDLREKVRQRRARGEESALLPAAQAMLLRCLYEGWNRERPFPASAIMGDLGYSRVTLSKVVDQLLGLKILDPLESGRSLNFYGFAGNRSDVFQMSRRYLRSPVRRRVAINTEMPFTSGVFFAGETALAHYSMLAEPIQPVYGMTKKRFDELMAADVFQTSDVLDDTQAWVEIWAYDTLRKDINLADQASLLLSLEDSPDERIQIALGELKEQVEWLGSGD